MIRDNLVKSVKEHEGFRDRAYQDSVGVWTIGYGSNLQTRTITPGEAEKWLIDDLNASQKQLMGVDSFCFLDPIRQDVLTEMCYNLGFDGLRQFRKMWIAIEAGAFDKAAAEMLDSKWATQVGKRARTLAERMRTGKWETSKARSSSSGSGAWF